MDPSILHLHKDLIGWGRRAPSEFVPELCPFGILRQYRDESEGSFYGPVDFSTTVPEIVPVLRLTQVPGLEGRGMVPRRVR